MRALTKSGEREVRIERYRRDYESRLCVADRCSGCKHLARVGVHRFGICELLDIFVNDVRRSQCPGFEEATP